MNFNQLAKLLPIALIALPTITPSITTRSNQELLNLQESTSYDGQDADLINAIVSGDIITVERLIASGVDANTKDSYGRTALMYASYSSHEIIRILLLSGADVNAKGQDGETALMMASCIVTMSSDTIDLLIASGADVNATDNYGTTALMEAVRYAPAEVSRTLISAGADVNAINNAGYTPLGFARISDKYRFGIIRDRTEIIDALVTAGAVE